MKKIFAAIVTAAFAIYPCVCLASYIIYLKNGGEFVTERYWEEEGQIKFERYGGVIGIQKDLVKKIEEIEDLPEEKDETYRQKLSEPAEKEGAEKKGVSEAAGKAKEGLEEKRGTVKGKDERQKKVKEIDVACYEEEKRTLTEKYVNARQRLKEARRTRDRTAIREAKKEIKESEKELADLALKLKKDNDGVLPPWWFSSQTISESRDSGRLPRIIYLSPDHHTTKELCIPSPH